MGIFHKTPLAIETARHIQLMKRGVKGSLLGTGSFMSSLVLAAPAHNIDAEASFTTVTSNGNTHDVRSNVTVNRNAVNVFNEFTVGKNHTVNLKFNEQANNPQDRVVNIMKGNAAAEIHGVMNAYNNNALGGDVMFVSSNGFIVGASGVVNVGSLSVRTPDQSLVDDLWNNQGNIKAGQLDDLTAANPNFAISNAGLVSIKGRVYAKDKVEIIADEVLIETEGDSAENPDGISGAIVVGDVALDAAVNVGDLNQPTELVSAGGEIFIQASGDVIVSGALLADEKIDIDAQQAGFLAGAVVDARKSATSSAAEHGAISISVDDVLLDANLYANTIELEQGNLSIISDDNVVIAAAVDDLSNAEVDLSQREIVGQLTVAGELNIVAEGDDIPVTLNQLEGSSITAAQVDIDADVVNIAGSITTTNADADNASGILIDAPDIHIEQTALLDSVDGLVQLSAVSEDQVGVLQIANANASIQVDGSISASDVDIHAHADAQSTFFEDGVGSLITTVSAFLGVAFHYVDAQANASLSVGGTANIQADGDINIASSTVSIADSKAVSLNGNKKAAFATMFANTEATSLTDVQAGATIESGGELTLTSHNEVYNNAFSFLVIDSDTNKNSVAVAVAEADVSANTSVASGASLVGKNVNVVAENSSGFYASASTYGLKNDENGLAVALGDFNTEAITTVGADIIQTADGDDAGQVNILALDVVQQQQVLSAATVGSNALFRTLGSSAVKGIDKAQSGLNTLYSLVSGNAQSDIERQAGLERENGVVKWKRGLSLAVNLSEHNASAVLAGDSDQRAAPVVTADGNVSVAALQSLEEYRTASEAAVLSPPEQSDQTTQTQSALAMALNIAYENSDTVALVGEGVRIDANNVAVHAKSYMPISERYSPEEWDGAFDVINKINGIGGLQKNLLTSYANAGAEAEERVYGVSANVIVNDRGAEAWIDDGANITSSGFEPWSLEYTIENSSRIAGFLGEDEVFVDEDVNFAFDHAIDVKAQNISESIHIAGNAGALLIKAGVGTNKQGKSIGASLSYIEMNVDTVAGVGAAKLDGDVGVTADTDERHFLITPSSGVSSGDGFNGIMGIINTSAKTYASISNLAEINAMAINQNLAGDFITSGVSVKADYATFNWSAAGAFNWTDQDAIGVAIAVNAADADTKAY
ncbi:MAG: leukotoxin LktA family filamentous adhesin, partial [Pseudomonadales bacterium]|nr:leukotoxin LktA family filamentous adhesin [Pseudomonadales bacterium]